MHSVAMIMIFVTGLCAYVCHAAPPALFRDSKLLAVLARAYLDEATDPENVEAQSCPISPCLRQLRPAILHAQHLLTEVTSDLLTSMPCN